MQERMKGIISEIEKVNADFVCMQEVKKDLLQEIISHPYVKENYYLTDISGKTFGGYGCVCAQIFFSCYVCLL